MKRVLVVFILLAVGLYLTLYPSSEGYLGKKQTKAPIRIPPTNAPQSSDYNRSGRVDSIPEGTSPGTVAPLSTVNHETSEVKTFREVGSYMTPLGLIHHVVNLFS